MSRKFLFLFLFPLVAALAAFGGWRYGRHSTSAAPGVRRVLFYQSPMHPWIKSDHPGNCTICGMQLVPVYEGETGTAESDGSLVKLNPNTDNVVHVETALVSRQPLRRVIHVAGQINDDDTARRRLSAYIDGRIDKLFVNYVGAEVKAGQPLASFYSRDLLVARSEFTEALRRPASPERESILGASRQRMRRMGLTPEQIEKLPGKTGDTFDIVAPISGTVVERKVYEGQYVKEGDVLFEIGNFAKMWFMFDAYERDLAWLRVGQSVEVSTPSVPGKVFVAPIVFIDPNLVMETRAAKVRVVLENPRLADPGITQRELLRKVYAEGQVRVETDPVLTVPRTAVLSPGGEALVYVVKGEHQYEPRRVVLGRAGDDVWEVVNGLEDGERVVTTGNLLVDSQAQLERPAEVVTLSHGDARLTDAQRVAADRLLAAEASVAQALAADDLATHNQRIAAVREAGQEMNNVLGGNALGLRLFAEVHEAPDLTTARQQFYPLGRAVAELGTRLRLVASTPTRFKIYECPMAQTAVPSAETNQGRWVQMEGPLRNPFFGAKMIDCGTEVRP